MASGMFGWIQDHPDLALGGGVVAVLLIAGSMFKAKTPGVPGTATQDLSGLTNGIVYVPTQTSFTTNNRTQSGVFASNDPTLTTVTTGPVNSPTVNKPVTTTTNPPPVVVVPPVVINPPPRQPPPPPPNPPPTTKSLHWDVSYTIVGGDTLSAIAARLTVKLRGQGMPGSMSITWSDLYGHNTAKINSYAQAHGFRSDYWNWIFPGETITVPRWA